MISKKRSKQYCCEDLSKIENYDKAIADRTQMWHCHHRLEVQGQFSNSVKLLKRCGMYWKRPANELIFLTPSDHLKLHSMGRTPWNKGKHPTEETRRKMSDAHKSKRMSEEARKKISEARKGKKASEETRKKLSEAAKNMSEETRRKMSETRKGKKRSEETNRKVSNAVKDWWAKRKAEAL